MRISLRVPLMVFVVSAAALAAPQYVQVKKPLANVYEYLDPQSRILVQAKRGDHFELVYTGTSWYQVKHQGQVGWLERRAGEVVNSTSSVSMMTIFLFIALLVGTLVVVFVFIQKQKTVEV